MTNKETEWIPFTFDKDGILNCIQPQEDEEILVSDGKTVWIDTFMCNVQNGKRVCWLDSCEPFEGKAWRSMPKPWGGKEDDK